MLNLLFAHDRRCFNSNFLSKFYFKTLPPKYFQIFTKFANLERLLQDTQ